MARDLDKLRRKVLDASIALVAEHGVRAVSFREVARRAGVSHQTPYHHFGDHLGILHAVAKEGFAALTAAMTAAAASAGEDPPGALHAAGVAYVAFARSHVGHFRVMFQRTLVDVHDEQMPLPEADQTYGTLVRLATAVHRAGYGGRLSAEGVAHLSWSTVHGLSLLLVEGIMASKRPSRRANDADLIRQVVGGLDLLLRTRRPAPGSKAALPKATARRQR